MSATDPHRYGFDRTYYWTSFEAGEPVPDQDTSSALAATVGKGPAHLPSGRAGAGLQGVRALQVTSAEPVSGTHRRMLVDDLDLPVDGPVELRYAICPVLDEELTYRSTYVALDCLLDDGSWVSESAAVDQHGFAMSAPAQGAAKILLPDHWNTVRVDLTAARGRRVMGLAVVVDVPTDQAGLVDVWLDDVGLGAPQARSGTDPLDWVDTRRGTHSSGAYSRGNTVPAAAMPNGFGLLVPLTDAGTNRWLYSWSAHNDAGNRPCLQGVGICHIPSPWMGDRDQLAVHLATAPSGTAPDASLAARGLPFSHEEELARPHHYQVRLDAGHQVLVHPTDHGGLIQFTFAAGTPAGQVILDAVSDEGATEAGRPVQLYIDAAEGSFTGWTDHGSVLSVGRSRMFVVGRFDRAAEQAGMADGDRPHARFLTFDTSAEPVVELRFATSYLSIEQAWHSYDLELAGLPAGEIADRAGAAWRERLGVLEVSGASAEQLATVYGNLYRLNLYPSSYTENAGTAAAPDFVHASPVAAPAGVPTDTHTGAQVFPGQMYVNHGFWDTYRTCWSAYALLYPQLAARLADGFVQQFREGGWIARWSSPGYADLMTGTSSDAAFADVAARGVRLPDPLGTYDAALRNATVRPPAPGVGRKGAPFTFLRGYVRRELQESASWSLEGYINDAALADLAARLAEDPVTPQQRRRALRDEAAYFTQRARGYVHLFDAVTGFFRGRGGDGQFAEEFDPESWGGDYTETNAWNFAFHALHDGVGLAHLYGGAAGLGSQLEAFFATPERADKRGTYAQVIHEMVEARDVRMGQLGQSNQPAHHIPYIPLFAGRPDLTQRVVREILTRLWTGNDIGQGYHGDEDNGQMSAWYLLSALGLYPLRVGSDQWVLGAPLFERAVLHLPGGDLVVEAPGNTLATAYVHGVALDGAPIEVAEVAHADLLGGRTLRFEMSEEPGDWGSAAMPSSLTPTGQTPSPWRDVSGQGFWVGSEEVQALADDIADVTVDVGDQVLHWQGDFEEVLRGYTLTSAPTGAPAPAAWRLEVRADGGSWMVADERSEQDFWWQGQLRPFVLDQPVPTREVRLSVIGGGTLSQVEWLVEG